MYTGGTIDHTILLTTDGKGIAAKREVLSHMLDYIEQLQAENERLNELIRKVSKGGIPERQRTFEGVCDYLYCNHEK